MPRRRLHAGTLNTIVPAGANAQVMFDSGLSKVTTVGGKVHNGILYTYSGSGPTINGKDGSRYYYLEDWVEEKVGEVKELFSSLVRFWRSNAMSQFLVALAVWFHSIAEES